MSLENQKNDDMSKELSDKLIEIKSLLNSLGYCTEVDPEKEIFIPLHTNLEIAGWSNERNVDISHLMDNQNPNKINKMAAQFISRFNSLSVKFQSGRNEFPCTYHFNAEWAMRVYHMETQEDDEAILKTKLCAVGFSDDGYIILLIAETGKVFASVDTNLYFVADSYQEALENLNRDEPFQPIEEWLFDQSSK